MTDYPIVRFVSGLSSDASTRFDFHELGVSSTDPAAWVWTPGGLLGDPDSINPDYGFGRLDFDLQVHTSHADAVRIMAALARELRRSSNFLLFEFDAYTPPAWLEVFPSSPGALGFPYAKPGTDDSVWVIPVSLTTGATWIGEQVTHAVTVANDPAVANGIAVTLPEIVGDAPAPLTISSQSFDQVNPVYAVAPLSSFPGIQFWQAEALTLGTDATVAASTAASGGSLVVVSFATSSMTTRLSGKITPAQAGLYRLFARVEGGFVTASHLTIRGGGSAVVAPETTESTATEFQFVSLGTYAFPKGNMPVDPGYTLNAGPTDTVTIEAARTSGVDALRIDCIIAVPCEVFESVTPTRMLAVLNANLNGHKVDGEEGRVAPNAGGTVAPRAADSLQGDFPQGVPGATNVLYAFRSGTYTISGSATLLVSHRPRHVYLPGS